MKKDKPEVHDLSNTLVLLPKGDTPQGPLYEPHALDCPSVPSEVRDRAIALLTDNERAYESENGRKGPAMVNNQAYRTNYDAIFGNKTGGIKN